MSISPEAVEAIGYIGGYVVAIASPFQLAKCLRTWQTRDVSLLWISNYLSGLLLIFAYGILAKLPAIWVPIILEIVCSFGIFALKIYIEFIEGVLYTAEVETQCDECSVAEAEGDKIIYARPRFSSKDEYEDNKIAGKAMKIVNSA